MVRGQLGSVGAAVIAWGRLWTIHSSVMLLNVEYKQDFPLLQFTSTGNQNERVIHGKYAAMMMMVLIESHAQAMFHGSVCGFDLPLNSSSHAFPKAMLLLCCQRHLPGFGAEYDRCGNSRPVIDLEGVHRTKHCQNTHVWFLHLEVCGQSLYPELSNSPPVFLDGLSFLTPCLLMAPCTAVCRLT